MTHPPRRVRAMRREVYVLWRHVMASCYTVWPVARNVSSGRPRVTAVARRVMRPWLRVTPLREGVGPGDWLVRREWWDVGWLRHRGSRRLQVVRP